MPNGAGMAQPQMPPQPQKRKTGLIIGIVAACVAVVVAVGALTTASGFAPFNLGASPVPQPPTPTSSSSVQESSSSAAAEAEPEPEPAAPASEADAETIEAGRPVVKAYSTACAGQSGYDTSLVNPEIIDAAKHGEHFQYAFYDCNGDGKKDLIIASDRVGKNEGLECDYTLYDLYGIGQNGAYRIIDNEHMQSLGYRSYCVICEDDVLATGGSGGATYNVRQYNDPEHGMAMGWRDRVTIDGDTYTFDSGKGSQVLTGSEGKAHYQELIAQYRPVTDIVWHSLDEYPSADGSSAEKPAAKADNSKAIETCAKAFCQSYYEHKGGVPGGNVDTPAQKRSNQVAECLEHVEEGSPIEDEILNNKVTVNGYFAGSLIVEVRDVSVDEVDGSEATATVTYAAAYAAAGTLPDTTKTVTVHLSFSENNLVTNATEDGEFSPTF